jgi:thiamine-phosphate pyrophosphorylase
MPDSARVRGLYAIADTQYLSEARLTAAVGEAIAGGAKVVQYRDKGTDAERRRAQARALLALCRRHGVAFIVNDHVALAAALGADGVHIGRDDPGLADTRRQLGGDRLIGVSCYNELERALAAQSQGADYVAFGSFFPSPTKPQAVHAGVELLRAARAQLRIPIVAIGGITPENGADLLAAGADALAVIDGVFNQPDIRAAAQRYARLFTTTTDSA